MAPAPDLGLAVPQALDMDKPKENKMTTQERIEYVHNRKKTLTPAYRLEIINKEIWDDNTQSWMTVIEFVDMSDHEGSDDGSGSGTGYGDGSGAGYGEGSGSGYGYDNGTGFGSGFGDGYGTDYGAGDGSGSSSEHDAGYGRGCGAG